MSGVIRDLTADNDTWPGGFTPDVNTGNDSINGLAGNDTLDGGNGNDTLDGGNGDDSILAGFGGDSALGGDGQDTLIGGNDSVYTDDDGYEFVESVSSNQSLNGGAGNDLLQAGTGDNQSLAGDAGNDTLQFLFQIL